jgi:hypothetical protein
VTRRAGRRAGATVVSNDQIEFEPGTVNAKVGRLS